MKKHQGIALIQVLLFSGILTILGIYISQTARDQVTMARWNDDKAQALVNLHGSESEMLFTLLTEQKHKQPANSNPIPRAWNFFGLPFALSNGIVVQIQDQSSLLNLHNPDKTVFRQLLSANGYDHSIAENLYDTLLDWQDIDMLPRSYGAESGRDDGQVRNGVMPNTAELWHLDGITSELYRLLSNNATIFQRSPFNPMNAPDRLLEAMFEHSTARQIIQLRNSGQLDKRVFKQLTGTSEDENVQLYTSNSLSMTITSQVGDSRVQKRLVVYLRPYFALSQRPVTLLLNRS